MFFQLKVRLNIHYFPSNGFHILRSYFKFTYSVTFSENYGSVTFSEKPGIDDVISQGLSRGMSHEMVYQFVSTCMTSHHSCGVTSQY